MKPIALYGLVLLGSLPSFAAISGTVVNGTTGKPQAGIPVTLLRMTTKGPEPAGEVKADAQGKFSIDQPVQGPTLVRATLDGVTYNKVLAPGMPSEGLMLDIYNASPKAPDARVSKHMILFEPTTQDLVINEAYVVSNNGKTAWNDPTDGTLHFFVPGDVRGQVQVTATPPGGQPLPQMAQKTDKNNIYKINFAMRPGDSRIDLTYNLPYQEGTPYAGKIVSNDENTYLIVPAGVSMKGDNLTDMGEEPRTQAHIYGLKSDSYQVELVGTVSARNTDPNPSSDTGNDGQPPIQQIMPRIYSKVNLILPLALGILALGFVLLYRMPSKELNERARR